MLRLNDNQPTHKSAPREERAVVITVGQERVEAHERAALGGRDLASARHECLEDRGITPLTEQTARAVQMVADPRGLLDQQADGHEPVRANDAQPPNLPAERAMDLAPVPRLQERARHGRQAELLPRFLVVDLDHLERRAHP